MAGKNLLTMQNWLLNEAKPDLGYVPLWTPAGLLVGGAHATEVIRPDESGNIELPLLAVLQDEKQSKFLMHDKDGIVLGELEGSLVSKTEVVNKKPLKIVTAQIDKSGIVRDPSTGDVLEETKLVATQLAYKVNCSPVLYSPPGKIIVIKQDEEKVRWQQISVTYQYSGGNFQSRFHLQATRRFFLNLQQLAKLAIKEIADVRAKKGQEELVFSELAFPAWFNANFGDAAPKQPPKEGSKLAFPQSIILGGFCNTEYEHRDSWKNLKEDHSDSPLKYPGVQDVSSVMAGKHVFTPRDIPGLAAKDKKHICVTSSPEYQHPWDCLRKGDIVAAPWRLTAVTLIFEDGSSDQVKTVYFNWCINKATVFAPEALWAADNIEEKLPFILDCDDKGDRAEGQVDQYEFFQACAAPIGENLAKKRKKSASKKADKVAKESKKPKTSAVAVVTPVKPPKAKAPPAAPARAKAVALPKPKLIDDEADVADYDEDEDDEEEDEEEEEEEEVIPNPYNSEEDAVIHRGKK